MTFRHSTVHIVTDADRSRYNAWRESLGHGPDNASVPLVPAAGPDDGTPTHWGTHGWWDDEFTATVDALRGSGPDPMRSVLGRSRIQARTSGRMARMNFEDAIAAMGLKVRTEDRPR